MEPGTFNSQLLTPARFRWVLDIGESTEAEWREQKAVAYFTKGRVIRYAPASVLEFIARQTVKARGTNRTEGTNGFDDLAWQRIERLIADQVRAKGELVSL